MTEQPDDRAKRQRVVRVAGARRARLTPVAGSDPEPESGPEAVGAEGSAEDRRPRGPKGPNDDRLIQDVPPHY
ncbi:hypothetical protein [Microbacterium sp. SA39]|uniref:hypothetical protein n=1 Tax=Microbacterium sp. SA39 TaxID=1263625 RepID=UPI0005FA4FC8|nr:hypothetical protein [Microbacterium sp. SA39]